MTRLRPLLLLLLPALAGCCCCGGGEAPPDDLAYAPKSAAEKRFFAEAARDVFPEDIRKAPPHGDGRLLLWSGILQDAEADGATVRLRIEHHYWDWIEDHGGRGALLSPRGEGMFECLCAMQSPEEAEAFRTHLPPAGDMILAYGIPMEAVPSGPVRLRCKYLSAFRAARFSTEVLDYGRDWLLKGDPEDCRPLPRD